jgi:hypothetical protein
MYDKLDSIPLISLFLPPPVLPLLVKKGEKTVNYRAGILGLILASPAVGS